MKAFKLTTILLAIVIVGSLVYSLLLFVGMSSTFSPIKEYHLATTMIEFEQMFVERINTPLDWSFEKTDSVRGEKGEVCYWASLFYNENEQQIKYEVKYCIYPDRSNNNEKCLTLYLVGAFNYLNKSGGYRLSDKDVDQLVKILDRKLGELSTSCDKMKRQKAHKKK